MTQAFVHVFPFQFIIIKFPFLIILLKILILVFIFISIILINFHKFLKMYSIFIKFLFLFFLLIFFKVIILFYIEFLFTIIFFILFPCLLFLCLSSITILKFPCPSSPSTPFPSAVIVLISTVYHFGSSSKPLPSTCSSSSNSNYLHCYSHPKL